MERLPHDYPWTDDTVPGVLSGGRFEPREQPVDGIDLACRRAVVAVGSNASPAVLASKLPLHEIPLLPATLIDVAVGHSAHVSLRGYIAAAPFPSPGAQTPVTISWLDPEALARLDATEPNYDRVTVASIGGSLGADLPLDPDEVDIYVSRHGVIGDDDDPWLLASQTELFSALADQDDLAEVFVGDAADVCTRLAEDADARAAVTEALKDVGRSGD